MTSVPYAGAEGTKAGLVEGAPIEAGAPLREALVALRERGMAIVFTRQLVRDELRVMEPPVGHDLALQLQQLLAPHGLRALERSPGTWVVVRAQEHSRRPGLEGMVRSRHTREPLAGVAVTVAAREGGTTYETHTRPDGRFSITAVAPGDYSLTLHHYGFVDRRIEGARVGSEGTLPLVVEMVAEPLLQDEIVVRSSQVSLLELEPSAPLALSRRQIEELPHLGGDVLRALSLFSGTAANDVTAQFSVRGGRRDEVKIVLDGQELYDAFHLQDYDNALSQVASEELGSVRLTTGGFAAEYGDRMGAVLDLRTKTHAGVSRSRLSLSLLTALASNSGSLPNDRGGWLVSGRRGSIDLANKVIGQQDPELWDAFAKLTLSLGDRQRLDGHTLYAEDRLRFAEAVGTDFVEEKLYRTDYSNSLSWLTHQAVIGDDLLGLTRAAHSRSSRDRFGQEVEEEQQFLVDDGRTSRVLELNHSWTLQRSPRQTLVWGIEGHRFDSTFDYQNVSEQELGLIAPGAETVSEDQVLDAQFRSDHFGAYTIARFAPVDPLTFELGLRYDRHTLTDDSLISPRANIALRLGRRGLGRFSWGTFHQSQRPYELQVEDGETRFFRAERARHFTLGYEHQLGNRPDAALRAVRVELFRRDISHPRPRYENLIEGINVFPEIERDRVFFEPSSARSQGVEMFLSGSGGPRIGWWLSYSRSEARDVIDGLWVVRKLDQTDAFNLAVDVRLPRAWSVNLAWRYHTGWPTTPISLTFVENDEGELGPALLAGDLNSSRLSPYHRLDLRLSRRFQLRTSQLTLFFDIQNLYDRKNQAGFDFEVDEDSGQLLRSTEEWTGIFPSVGVSWEF